MNEREGGGWGALFATISSFISQMGEMIDWSLLLNSTLNAFFGAFAGAIAVFFFRKIVQKTNPLITSKDAEEYARFKEFEVEKLREEAAKKAAKDNEPLKLTEDRVSLGVYD